MNPIHLHERAAEAALAIAERVTEVPKIAVVLGSGMGSFVDDMADAEIIPYVRIPHFPRTTVPGHHGNLAVGVVGGKRVVALQGRFHHYEGHDLGAVTFPMRVLRALEVQTVILTAATGGIREDLRPGDLMALSDHLNLLGANPLRGPNDDRLGPRFPDMGAVYSPALRDLAKLTATDLQIELKEGVYACLPGPSYETPAEIRMLRALGADVVGMSTVPEAIVARHAGMDVLAFAIVTNAAAGLSGDAITHEEVLEEGRAVGPRLASLIAGVVERMH
jgi:purine-nucleoside phosphorylase